MIHEKTEPIVKLTPPGAGSDASPSAWQRVARYTTMMVPATIVLSGVVLLADAVLPSSIKPSTHLGGWLGKIHTSEILSQQATVIDNTRRMAEAQAGPGATYQMEILAFQQQMQAAYEALQTKVAMANAADLACTLSPIVGMLVFQDGSTEARNAAQLGLTACQYATRLRQEIAAEQAQLARANSALVQRQAAGGRN